MDDPEFKKIKAQLDADLGRLPANVAVGIKMGWDLYTEFRSRGLLKPKEADMILVKWMLPSYQDKYVADTFDIADDAYEVGRPNAP